MAFAFVAPLLEGLAGGAAAEGAVATGGAAAAEGAAASGTTAGASGASRTFSTALVSHFTGGHGESRGDAAPAAPTAAHQTNPVFN